MSVMRRIAAGLAASCLALGCHLADSPDPVRCDPGQHAVDGHCAFDESPATTFVISPGEGGAGCSVSPSSITVALSATFELKNGDTVDHVITGADGQTWATVKAEELSPFIGLTKAGTWPFTVSGCVAGGTVVVE